MVDPVDSWKFFKREVFVPDKSYPARRATENVTNRVFRQSPKPASVQNDLRRTAGSTVSKVSVLKFYIPCRSDRLQPGLHGRVHDPGEQGTARGCQEAKVKRFDGVLASTTFYLAFLCVTHSAQLPLPSCLVRLEQMLDC